MISDRLTEIAVVDHVAQVVDRLLQPQQVVVDIAKVVLQSAADRRDASAVQFTGHLEQRLRRVIEGHQLALQRIQRFDLRARRLTGKNPLLDLFDLRREAIDDRKIAIDDVVHQRVEHVGRTVLQQLRFLLAAAPHVGEAELRVAPHRDDVLRADEDRDFAGLQIARPPARSSASR